MPELPEVETIRAQLAERITGRTIKRIEVVDPKFAEPATPDELIAAVRGRQIEAVTRRGKYLMWEFPGGDALAIHLRMTGRLHWRAGPPDEPPRFLRAMFALDDGATMTFSDMRRFGRAWMLPADPGERQDYWRGRVGPEPLAESYTGRDFAEAIGGRSGPIKGVILNQAVVAGVGNMYADEALFQARIHPERPAASLDDDEARLLHEAIRDRLRVAIAHGGASIDDYRDGLGDKGRMQEELRVHLHEGEPCPRCAATIVKTRVAQRGTYTCPSCQPRHPGRRSS